MRVGEHSLRMVVRENRSKRQNSKYIYIVHCLNVHTTESRSHYTCRSSLMHLGGDCMRRVGLEAIMYVWVARKEVEVSQLG